MDMDVLQKFLPKLGDRLAVVDFCTRANQNKRKDSLLEKLREKLKRKKGAETGNKSLTSEVIKQKETRMIEIGWLHFDNGRLQQVRTKQGGGTRKISVRQEATREDIHKIAKTIFFEDGMSSKGHETQFDFTVADFRCQELDNDITVREIFQKTGMSRLRFYITTRNKRGPSTIVRSHSQEAGIVASECAENQNLDESFYLNQPENTETDLNIADRAIRRSRINLIMSSDNETAITEITYTTSPSVSNSDLITGIVDLEDLRSLSSVGYSDIILEEPGITKNSTNNSILIVHRGHVLEEMIEQFLYIEIDNILEIEIYLPNGEKEVAQNVGGVFRDILSEFWNDFFLKYTVGSYAKIPVLRHDFDGNKWLTVAKILKKGWLDEKYFPIQFSKIFMEKCMFGETLSDLTEDFLKYVSEMDSKIMKKAIDDFGNVDEDELLECLENLDCKWKPNRENIEKLIFDLAHKELIQKPMFIINNWSTILNNMMTSAQHQQVYSINENLPRNILKKLTFDEILNSAQQTVANFLKKFIRESEKEILCNFLRFVTGANMVIGESTIQVSFSTECNINMRTPTAHTCSCLLVLPATYDSYTEFKHEFSSVLNSKIWVMDII